MVRRATDTESADLTVGVEEHLGGEHARAQRIVGAGRSQTMVLTSRGTMAVAGAA